MSEWDYENWPPTQATWLGTEEHVHPHEQDPHVDLGCGKVKKARIGVDRFAAPGVDVVVNLERARLPFDDRSIESIISYHCFEHIGAGFIALVDEIYRVLKPGGVLRAITPLFPSYAAVSDPDHKRYFCEDTWVAFCGHLGDETNPTGCWLDGHQVPYTKARFAQVDHEMRGVVSHDQMFTPMDRAELRVSLEAVKA